MANDIYLLLQRLKVVHCHIVGISMGAEVVLSLAASHPEFVLSLICEGALYNEYNYEIERVENFIHAYVWMSTNRCYQRLVLFDWSLV